MPAASRQRPPRLAVARAASALAGLARSQWVPARRLQGSGAPRRSRRRPRRGSPTAARRTEGTVEAWAAEACAATEGAPVIEAQVVAGADGAPAHFGHPP